MYCYVVLFQKLKHSTSLLKCEPCALNFNVGHGLIHEFIPTYTRASGDFWLASPYCCSNTSITHTFDAFASSSWVNSTNDFAIPYGSSNISGWIGTQLEPSRFVKRLYFTQRTLFSLLGTDTVSVGHFTIEGQAMGK